MTRHLLLFAPLFSSIFLARPHAQSLGTAPPFTIDVTNVYTAFGLPPLRDTSAGGLLPALSTTQVGQRAVMLGLNGQSPIDAWSAVAALSPLSGLLPNTSAPAVPFSGTTASALNILLAGGPSAIEVLAPALQLDQPIEIRRDGLTLDLARAQIQATGARPYMLRVDNARGVTVRGGEFVAGEAGILINASQAVRVQDVELRNLSSDGIVVTGSTQVVLTGNRIRHVSGASILLHRGTTWSLVEGNRVEAGAGASNMTAAIVLSDREVDLASDPLAIFGPDGYWVVSQPITARLHPPHDNLIAYNHLLQNSSSGVYVDGGVRNVIISNIIQANSKEGICLDNGATANVVASNIVEHNGDRWGEPDAVLSLDQVLAGGRLPDGTAAEKVPGVSLDNAMYNIVFANSIAHNFGGGVKLVRTGYFNLIGLNTIYSDNDGAGPEFHFFGVELGATPGDAASTGLDYTPSRGNIVFSNLIRGAHYSGVFFDAGSDLNDILDNTILDATHWALESVSVMANHPLNNLTNLPSRNIGSGLDPSLLTIGQPVLDPGQ